MGNTSTLFVSKEPAILNDSEALVYGFLRAMMAYPPNDIFQICYRFYFEQHFLFVSNSTAFHAVDITSPKHVELHKNMVQLYAYNSNVEYFDISCHIPNLFNAFQVHQILNLDDQNIRRNAMYHGILTRKLIQPRPPIVHNMLYLYPTVNSTESDYFVLQSSSVDTVHPLFDSWLYCGPHWGIIGTISRNIYQLKLDEIDTELQFTPRYEATHDSSAWSMDYLNDKDALFALQLEYRHPFKCALFDLNDNKWIDIHSGGIADNKWGQEYKFKWNIGHNGDDIYLVSNVGHVMQYNVVSDAWNYIHESNPYDIDFKFDNKPIVWSYRHNPHILYCGGTLESTTTLQLRCLDMRRNNKQWIGCFTDIMMSNAFSGDNVFR
eukprot:202414_1